MAIIVFLIHIKLYYMAVSCPHHQDQPCQVSEVLESRNPKFPPGSHVVAYTGWRELAVVHHQHRNYYHHYHHHLQYHDTFALSNHQNCHNHNNDQLQVDPNAQYDTYGKGPH